MQLSLYLARRHFEGSDNLTCGNISRKYGIYRKLVEIGYFEEIAAGWVGGGERGEAP